MLTHWRYDFLALTQRDDYCSAPLDTEWVGGDKMTFIPHPEVQNEFILLQNRFGDNEIHLRLKFVSLRTPYVRNIFCNWKQKHFCDYQMLLVPANLFCDDKTCYQMSFNWKCIRIGTNICTVDKNEKCGRFENKITSVFNTNTIALYIIYDYCNLVFESIKVI